MIEPTSDPMPTADDRADSRYQHLDREALIRLLRRRDAERQLGLVWERDELEAERALNDDFVSLELDPALSHGPAPWSNLIIEGDNYDALRHLRMTHAGRIRCIYIDPPYNTGNRDFVYNDRFVDKSHRFRHSLWLEFMYRRLTLARELLAEDGVIFVSIDDNELFRLGMLMDRVFGEGNRIATFIWRKVDSPSDNKSAIAVDHEYLLCFAANCSRIDFARKPAHGILEAYGKVDERERWYRDRLLKKNGKSSLRRDRPTMFFPIEGPDGVDVFPIHDNGDEARWSMGREAISRHKLDGTLIWKRRKKRDRDVWEPYTREYAPDSPSRPWPTIWNDLTTMRQAKAFLREVFGSGDVFDTPKPIELVEQVFRVIGEKHGVFLDFFAGSGTTAHAVARLNAEDGGNRRFILVSNTEATDEAPDKNLCRDVCAERVRRVLGGYVNNKGEAVAGLGGGFAYLRTRRIARHRLARRLDHAGIWHALLLIHAQPLAPLPSDAAFLSGGDQTLALAYLPAWEDTAVESLRAWSVQQAGRSVLIYTWTPERFDGWPPGVELRPIPEALAMRFGGASP